MPAVHVQCDRRHGSLSSSSSSGAFVPTRRNFAFAVGGSRGRFIKAFICSTSYFAMDEREVNRFPHAFKIPCPGDYRNHRAMLPAGRERRGCPRSHRRRSFDFAQDRLWGTRILMRGDTGHRPLDGPGPGLKASIFGPFFRSLKAPAPSAEDKAQTCYQTLSVRVSSYSDTRPVGLGSCLPTLRLKEAKDGAPGFLCVGQGPRAKVVPFQNSGFSPSCEVMP